MTSASPAPVGLVFSRRRFSSSGFGSGFEYPSHPVEEDILSRIRSLLLSRNRHRLPRAPNNSDEDLPRHVVHTAAGFGDVFDFATTKSVALHARSRSARMSLPGLSSRRSRPASLISMDGVVSPPLPVPKRATTRSVSSTNDLDKTNDNLRVDNKQRGYHSDNATSPDPGLSSKPTKKGFRFPRLVLKDKEKPNMLAVRSCMSTNGDDLACFIAGCDHPRLSPLEIAILREQRGHSRANSVDLENLTRSQEIMNKHGAHIALTRRSSISPVGSPVSASDYSQDGQKSFFSATNEKNTANGGNSEQIINRQSRVISAVSPGQVNTSVSGAAAPVNQFPQFSKAVDETAENQSLLSHSTAVIPSWNTDSSRDSKSQLYKPGTRFSRSVSRQEFNEGPLIPKNEEPIELVIRAQSFTPIEPDLEIQLKQSAQENPTVTAPKKELQTSPSAVSLAKKLESHERFQPKSPSLLSNSSKRSARHALLKPSITTTSPVDTGLPVPPVLTQIDTVIEELPDLNQNKVKDNGAVGRKHIGQVTFDFETMNRAKKIPKATVIDNLSSLQKARDAVSEVEERLRALQSDSSLSNRSELNQVPLLPEERECCSPRLALSKDDAGRQNTDTINNQLIDLDDVPLHEEYWGFTPAVKDAVQTAVKDAVRTAVNLIVPPTGNQPEATSRVYRRLLSDSIAEAAEEADVYLQQASLWEDRTPAFSANSTSKPDKVNKAVSVDSGENMFSPSRKSSPNNSNAVPLQTVEKALEANMKEYQRLAKMSKNGASPAFNTVPNRYSSRGRIAKRELPEDPQLTSETNSSDSKSNIGKKFDQKNTVRWLKDLLTSDESYQSRLTEMPARTRRDRINTAPADILIDMTDQPKSAVAETFTKTINDLEMLLNEALLIARQAADREDAGYIPASLGNTAAILKGGRKGIEDDIVTKRSSKGHQRGDITMSSDVQSIHESLQSLSDSSDSYHSSEEEERNQEEVVEYRTQVIPPPSMAKEIRVSTSVSNKLLPSPTPYPPASAKPSMGTITRPSIMGDEEDEEQSEFMDFDSDNVQRTPIRSPILEKRPSRVTPDMNPFLETPGDIGTRRRASTQVSPADMRSRRTTADRSQRKSIVIDDRAVPRTLSGPDPEPLPVMSHGEVVNVVRMGNNSWVEANIQDILSAERIPSRPDNLPSRREVREYIQEFHHPPIQPRTSSLSLRKQTEIAAASDKERQLSPQFTHNTYSWQDIDHNLISPCSQTDTKYPNIEDKSPKEVPVSNYSQSYDGVSASDALDFETGYGHKRKSTGPPTNSRIVSRGVELRDDPMPRKSQHAAQETMKHPPAHLFSLTGKHHLSLKGEQHKGFSLTRSHKKPKIARDWAPARKRFVASVACVSTALVGLLVGIYAAEVPAIQYYIVDFHHYVILGNVFFYIGLAIPTFFFWPLPLLHGRKPYIMGSMCLAMPLLFPQAVAVSDFRSPYTPVFRVALLLPRSFMGFVLGFANMNFKSTLTDLFGASLQSANPHQEVVDKNDVRRHGGGLGAWLGIWTWCTIGSIGLGFMFGAIIINNAPPALGFYISIVIIAAVLLLNVVCPEVRRSAFRRSVAEAKVGNDVSRRLGRGEVKMHMVQSGPKWWGQEFHHGVQLSIKMLRQPGFLILAFYTAWIYGQIVLVIVLLGSLTSKYYHLKSPLIGASVASVPIGAFLAIPFQKAGLFSRERTHAEKSDDDTRDKKPGWSSHFIRRAIFVICLPFAGLGYTLSSNGPPIPLGLPIFFAALIGFLSNLALAECHGIIMETFDTSDLQPGMTGRPRRSNKDRNSGKRTNYSSFPRVMSAFGITQCFGYLIGACATAVGGVAERNIGQQAATGVMAGILLILSVLLLLVLLRFREVQIVPDMHKDKMEIYMNARRKSAAVRGDDLADEDLRPTIIGNPTHTTRRMCILEMGSMTRWSMIRQKNHLVNQGSYEAKHPNLAVMKDAEERFVRSAVGSVRSVKSALSRSPSRSKQSLMSDPGPMESHEMNPMAFGKDYGIEQQDLGGHREMLGNEQGMRRSGDGSTNASRRGTAGVRRSQRGKRKSVIRE